MFDIEAIIHAFGLLGIAAIIVAETGLLLGFFLPGDTLLLFSGFFASQGLLPIEWLIITIVVSAIVGDNIGYSIGRRTGHRIFKKEDGILFHKDHLIRAEKFYEAHGGKTIILARFLPVIRTFAPLVAGIGKMDRRRFMFYNVFGALIWGVGLTLIGYHLGNLIEPEVIERAILPVILLATLLTFGPGIIHALRDPRVREKLKEILKRFWTNIRLNKR